MIKITGFLVQLYLQIEWDNRALFVSKGCKPNEIKSHVPEILELSMCAKKGKTL